MVAYTALRVGKFFFGEMLIYHVYLCGRRFARHIPNRLHEVRSVPKPLQTKIVEVPLALYPNVAVHGSVELKYGWLLPKLIDYIMDFIEERFDAPPLHACHH